MSQCYFAYNWINEEDLEQDVPEQMVPEPFDETTPNAEEEESANEAQSRILRVTAEYHNRPGHVEDLEHLRRDAALELIVEGKKDESGQQRSIEYYNDKVLAAWARCEKNKERLDSTSAADWPEQVELMTFLQNTLLRRLDIELLKRKLFISQTNPYIGDDFPSRVLTIDEGL